MQRWIFGNPIPAAWRPGIFWGIGANNEVTMMKEDDIIIDFSMNDGVVGGWNWLNLVATDNGTLTSEIDILGEYGELNQHLTAASLLVENRDQLNDTNPGVGIEDWELRLGDRSALNFFEKMCSLLGAEIDEFDEEPVKTEEIYPYTQNLGALMVYIPLGAIAALATVLKLRRYRTRKKVEKIKKKYTKIK